jgi:tetratricopeptide (TPR) repeat protein
MGQFGRAAADYHSAAACAERGPGGPGDTLSPVEAAKAFESDAALAELLLDADTCKREGDDKLKGKDLEGAVAQYNRALAIEPAFVPALVNRATARSLQGQNAACIEDCSAALHSLGVDDSDGSVEAAIRAATAAAAQGAFVPCWGSVRLAAWIKSACLRRAVSWMKVGDPKQGE